MARAIRAVHRWIGIALAIPIAAVALSGGLLLFKEPYYRFRYPVLAEPRGASPEASPAAVLQRIERRFSTPGVRVVKFPRDGFNAFHVSLADRSEALVHPSTGAQIARWSPSSSVPAFLFDLHAHLLAGATGERVNGYLALVLSFLALTGFVVWLPGRRAAFRLRHAIPRSAAPGPVWRAHAASGVVLLVPVLLFAVTGAGLVFYEQASAAMAGMFDRTPPQLPDARVVASERERRSWTEVLGAVRSAVPLSGPLMYYPGSTANPVLTFRTRLNGEWHPNGRSYVLVDPYTATVVQVIDAREQGAGTRIMHALYPIHAATIGGPGLVSLAALASAGLLWLASGSCWAFFGRRSARRRIEPVGRRRDALPSSRRVES